MKRYAFPDADTADAVLAVLFVATVFAMLFGLI